MVIQGGHKAGTFLGRFYIEHGGKWEHGMECSRNDKFYEISISTIDSTLVDGL